MCLHDLTASGGARGDPRLDSTTLSAGGTAGAGSVGVGTHDPAAIGAAAALLGAIAGLASALPARRAASLDPLRSLHG